MKSGAVCCLEKPFDVDRIVNVVNEQLEKYLGGERNG
jgi:FixJ family two-component response regulator